MPATPDAAMKQIKFQNQQAALRLRAFYHLPGQVL
jgi:hypothetical protein